MGGLPREDICTGRLVLRQFREDDTDDLTAAMSDPATARFLPRTPVPYTRDDARGWITTGAPKSWESGAATFALADPATDRLLGSAYLLWTSSRRRDGEIAYWISPWARGRGLAREALAVLTCWAFQHGLERLELVTALENVPSQRVALSAGYRREGVRRGGGWRPHGPRYDQVIWARLADDPPGPTPRLLPDLPGDELSDGVTTLRPLGTDDAEDAYHVLRLPEVVASSVPPVVPDREKVTRHCTVAGSEWLAGVRASLTIRDALTDRYAGEIALYYNQPPLRSGMIGYHLHPDWRGRGFATRAVRLLAHWSFTDAGLARLEAGTSPTNTPSQAVLTRVGFRRAALLRALLPTPTGTRADDLLYELVPSDLS